MTDYISTLSLILQIIGLFSSFFFTSLFILKNRYCWIFGILTAVSYFILFLKAGLVGSSITAIFFFIMSLYMFHYSKSERYQNNSNTKSVPIYYNVFYIVFSLLLFTCFFIVLKPISYSLSVLLDTICISFIIVTILLFIERITYAWLYWIILCILYILLFFVSDLKIMSFGQLINIIIAVYGYYTWNKVNKNLPNNSINKNTNIDIDKNFND